MLAMIDRTFFLTLASSVSILGAAALMLYLVSSRVEALAVRLWLGSRIG